MATITKTVGAKSKIVVNELFNTVRTITQKIEIQWNLTDWVDETTYLLSVMGNEKMEGDSGEGVASTLDFELDNTTDRFSPNNSSSELYAYLKPRVPVRVSITIDQEYRLFTGYIKNIHPNTKSRVCSFECFDNQVLVYNAQTNGIVYEDKRSDELLETLAGLAGLVPAQYSFDVGVHSVNFGYFENRNVWPVMGEIAVAERGRIFFDREGILTFWNRDKFGTQNPVCELTLDNWIADTDYSVAEHDIKNAVIVKATPRAAFPIQAVWANGDIQYLDPYTDTLVYVPAGLTQDAWLDLEDPCSTFITPVQNTDFTANSAIDGTGDDLTSSISIDTFTNFGNAVFISVKNNSAQDAYLTKFQVRGTPVRIINWVKVTALEELSVLKYGRQEVEIENNFIDSESTAWEIAEEELYRKKESINLFRINIVGNPDVECGNIVNVEHRANEFKNFMVSQIDWTLDDKGFAQKLTLVKPYLRPVKVSAKACIANP
jgi:hypothetical protein